MANSNKILGESYIPKYSKDYHSLPWYGRAMMTYIDWIKYKEMADNPDDYFKKKKMINFDIVHHESRGAPLQKIY